MFYGKKEISPKEHMVLLMLFNNESTPTAKYETELMALTVARLVEKSAKGYEISKKGKAFCHTQCSTNFEVDDIVKHPSTAFKRKVAAALNKTLAIEERFNAMVEKNKQNAS